MTEIKNCLHETLDTGWCIAHDPENNGLTKHWDTTVPGTAVPCVVPSIIQQTLPGCHGAAFYWCRFVPHLTFGDTDRIHLCFGGVDYLAQIWLNGSYIGMHEGGETPFTFDVTETLCRDGENLLSVRVINPTDCDIDGLNICNIPNRNKTVQWRGGSCMNSGGIWYDVTLSVLPAIFTDDLFLRGDVRTGALTAQFDLHNTLEDMHRVHASLAVYDRITGEKIVSAASDLDALPGTGAAELSLMVPDVTAWDIDNPYLYRVTLTLMSEFGEDHRAQNFGFREFRVVDGFFYLNGRKIFLKSSHTGNAFPIGQNYPVVTSQIRQDLWMAKSYGFNMIRSISGMLRPEQIAFCDELGLMVYEESYAAWQLGIGLDENALTKEEKDAMCTRYSAANIEMIRRDRNHPSVVAWGLLNEMPYQSTICRYAPSTLPLLRKYDPTRFIFHHSGRWDGFVVPGSGSNPYSTTWDALMGYEGKRTVVKDLPFKPFYIKLTGIGDYHAYPQFPLSEETANLLRTYCGDALPAFLSESGLGPLFNVIEEWKQFQQHGCREDLEDCRFISSQAQKLQADWSRLGLSRVFPYPEMFLKESQRLSAVDRRLLFDVIRSNPKHNGYSLTGLLDHGMCGEGLWSYWRRPKPEVYDAVCDGWAPLRFCLFVRHHVYRGEQFEIEAVLANECVLKPGTYTAEFAIVGENGTVMQFDEDFVIEDDAFAVPVMKRSIALDVPTGKYTLIAYLRSGGAAQGNRLDFYVKDASELPSAAGEITVLGLAPQTAELLRAHGAALHPFNGQKSGVILVGASASEEELCSLRDAAEAGAVVLFLDTAVFFNPANHSHDRLRLLDIAEDACVTTHADWLYHKECVAANAEIFAGLGLGCVDSVRYGQTFPHSAIETARTPEDVICPAFQTGFYGYAGGYGSMHTMAGFHVGCGRIYFNSFALEALAGSHPAADMLLLNYVRYLIKQLH